MVKSSSGTATVSIFSGSSVIAEYDNGAAPGSPSREYVYNDAGDTTGLLAMFSGGATTYYHQDHLSVRLTTDANGNVLSQQGTYPFGESWYQSGAGNKLVFTSYNRDSESGLDYAMARYYNSRTGTFCSADPLAGSPGDPQSWNRYPYVRNDPTGITDPSGKSWWSNMLIFIGAGVASAFVGPAIESLFAAPAEAGLDATAADFVAPVLHVHDAAAFATAAGDGAAAVDFSGAAGMAAAAAAAKASDQPKTPQEQMKPAMTIAMQALNKKECADMYGTPKSRANGFTPQKVLNGIVNGSKYGKIGWVNAGAGWVAETRPTFPYIGASSVLMKINTYDAPGYWSAGDAVDNAETLLNELAHAFNFIHGAGGFPISNFREAVDPYAFDKEVKEKCF